MVGISIHGNHGGTPLCGIALGLGCAEIFGAKRAVKISSGKKPIQSIFRLP
jgi:hypothetical protein